MNHKSELRPFSALPARLRSESTWKGLLLAVPVLLALGGTGCFRATGFQRTTVAAEAIPEFAGDRVTGLKSMAGPGDYYLGNDFIQIAIDGTKFGDTSQQPIAGAASGGSIVDAGYLSLDTSYQRVNIPADSLERLTPVVNQDPSLQLVFDSFASDSTRDPATLTLTGRLLDPNRRVYQITPGSGGTLPAIGGPAPLDGQGCVQGVTVTHILSLGKLDRFFTLRTTIVNESGSPLGILSIGDYLHQTSGGFRFSVPSGLDVAGNPLFQPWGIQIPGSNWGSPIATAVQANFVALLATEPGADTVDSHASLGLMSIDAPTCMVTSDAQDVFGTGPGALRGDKPVFPHQIAVGSLPLPPAGGLVAGGSLSFNRRLYVLGGTSTSAGSPSQTSTLFNVMSVDRYSSTSNALFGNIPNAIEGLWPQDYGTLTYALAGTASRQGPLPTQVLIERKVSGANGFTWIPERAEWFEPAEGVTSTSSLQSAIGSAYLLVGTYRFVITNAEGTQIKDQATNQSSPFRPFLPGDITVTPFLNFTLGGTDILCPEASRIVSEAGTVVRNLYTPHYFTSIERDSPTGGLQPLRIVVKGAGGTPDPWLRRSRTISTYFNAITKNVAIASSPGQRQFRAGNEMFGTSFNGGAQTGYFWLPNGTTTGQLNGNGNPVITGGTYTAYGTRGPLSSLQTIPMVAYDGQTDVIHTFIVWPQPLPTGWTTFDAPGPGLATTGGMLTGEKLASGMAEGIHVIAHTEEDLGTDADAMYNEITWETHAAGFLQTQLSAIGDDPFVVGGRTSTLPGYGTATALFTPAATRYRFGGAIQPNHWTLSDFLTQAQGRFTVVNQPRGAQGLFTLQGAPAPADPANWWNGTGVYANGQLNGSFDALELLRAEGFDGTDPDPWFLEFQQVRADWFALLNQQTPSRFTKALGLSSSAYSLDTPVGLARTYLKATPVLATPTTYDSNGRVIPPVLGSPLVQDTSSVLAALQAGAAVASTGPFLDVAVGATGPGGLVATGAPQASVNLTVNLYKSDWMPVDEVRIIVNGVPASVVVNGVAVTSIPLSALAPSATDARLYTGVFPVAMPNLQKGAWLVVEAGVSLNQRGPYAVGTPWHDIMRGIYPIAVTNPIFIDVTGSGYQPPVS